MNRIKERKKDESEWGRTLFKSTIDEIHFSKARVWKITYYTLLVYVALFTMINIFMSQKKDLIFIIFYLILLIASSISFKLIINSHSIIIKCKKEIIKLMKEYKLEYNINIFQGYGIEDFHAFYYTLCFGYIITLINIKIHHVLDNYELIIIILMYLGVEIPLMISRSKTNKKNFIIDAIINSLLVIGIILVNYTSVPSLELFKDLIHKFLEYI